MRAEGFEPGLAPSSPLAASLLPFEPDIRGWIHSHLHYNSEFFVPTFLYSWFSSPAPFSLVLGLQERCGLSYHRAQRLRAQHGCCGLPPGVSAIAHRSLVYLSDQEQFVKFGMKPSEEIGFDSQPSTSLCSAFTVFTRTAQPC